MAWDSTEIMVLIGTFIGIFIIRMFLFRKSYNNKMKYYTDPYELA